MTTRGPVPGGRSAGRPSPARRLRTRFLTLYMEKCGPAEIFSFLIEKSSNSHEIGPQPPSLRCALRATCVCVPPPLEPGLTARTFPFLVRETATPPLLIATFSVHPDQPPNGDPPFRFQTRVWVKEITNLRIARPQIENGHHPQCFC
jgi:hypothetical protein